MAALKVDHNYMKKQIMSDIDEPSESERDDDIVTKMKSISSDNKRKSFRKSKII